MKALLAGALIACAAAGVAAQTDVAALEKQVADAERAFATTMAERDFEAFKKHLSEEAVFFNGDTPVRGKAQVAEAWKGFYQGPKAPFSWEPKVVQVLDSGTLALSSGPVLDPNGKHYANFTSIWRLENGTWRVIFDKGNPACQKCN